MSQQPAGRPTFFNVAEAVGSPVSEFEDHAITARATAGGRSIEITVATLNQSRIWSLAIVAADE